MLDWHSTEIAKENLKINVELKCHLLAVSPHLLYMYLRIQIPISLGNWSYSLIQQAYCAHCPTLFDNRPYLGGWKWILAKGPGKPAGSTGRNVLLQPSAWIPQLFHELNVGLSGQSTPCCNGKVNSRVKLGQVRRVLGKLGVGWGRQWEVLWCWPAVLRALRDFRWPDPSLLQALCLSWCQMPCDCKDHRFKQGETVGANLG